jgi:hypothetical protein
MICMRWTIILIESNSGHVRHARSDLRLVLANMRMLFTLVTMRPSHAGDGAVVDRSGAVVNCPGATDDR